MLKGENHMEHARLDMTLPEYLAMIKREEARAAQLMAEADALERLMEALPEWDLNPELSLGDILARTRD
jgi:hypothetical protein